MEVRSEFISRLKDMPTEYAEVATRAFDFILHNYEVVKKQTALSTVVNQLPREVALYRDCKVVEGYSKEGINNRLILINSLLLSTGKSLPDITANDIRAFLYEYQDMRNVKDNTLDRYRSYLSAFFKWCLDEEIISKDPTRNIKPIKHEKSVRTSLTQVELEYIRKACKTARERAIIELLYSTGCRVSELAGLKLESINLTDNSAIVHGKGKKVRKVYINAKALVALNEYLKVRVGTTEYLLVARNDRAMSARAVRDEVEKVVARSGLNKKITPHTFRHTTATTALQNGMPIEEISTMLGHAEISTTLLYAHVNESKVHQEHTRCVI